MEDKEIFNLWEIYKSLLLKTKRPGVEEMIKWLEETDFRFAPASGQFHGNFRGGLLLHSLNVYYFMYDFVNFIEFFNISEESIIITSLLHDICKVNTYVIQMRNKKDENGKWIQVPYYQKEDLEPLGHAEKSIMYIYEHGINLTKLERAMIRNHMGFAEGTEKRYEVGQLFAVCPQSLLLHWADEAATYIKEGTYISENFKRQLYGRNITESLSYCRQIKQNKEIEISGVKYKIAPEDSVVDNKNIIEMNLGLSKVKIINEN